MKTTCIALVSIALVLSGATSTIIAGAPVKKTAPWKKPPPAKAKPAKPTKPKAIPTRYSGRASAVNLSNHMNGAVWRIADTGPLPSRGGSLSACVGATTLDNALHVDGAHAATAGIGCVSTANSVVTNFTAIFIHNGLTNVIAFAYAASEARAECTPTGVVLSASSIVQGLTIDGADVAVTGEANQVITIAAGSIILNAQTSSLSTNCQYGEITVAAIYLMLTDCFHGPIAYAEADIQCGSKVPPAVRQCDKVTGGGFIVGTPSGAHGSFGVGGGIRRGQFWGHLNYIDHGTGMHVHATAVTGYTALDTVTRQIDYDVTIDGTAGTARVIVADNGEPGRNDIFDITLSTGYHAGGDLAGPQPGGGNIQLHKCPPGWQK